LEAFDCSLPSKARPMIAGILLIMVFQFAGEVTVASLQLTFPGSLCGLIYLLLWLLCSGGPSKATDEAASTLLANFGLMFVPAGAAIIVFMNFLRDEWFVILVALVVSTLGSIAIAGLVAETRIRIDVAKLNTHEVAE
jgi:holin-like protein